MKKIINLMIKDELIEIKINEELVLNISTDTNSINIKTVYSKLDPQENDEFELDESCKKIEKAKSYLDNLYNNALLFFDELIKELNKICVKEMSDI